MAKSSTWDRFPRICLNCNNQFIPITKWQITCSYKCGYQHQNAKKFIPINSGNCVRCGKSLIDKKSHAIYCSKTCKSMDHNFKRRAGAKSLTTARRRLIIERDKQICYICNKFVLIQDIEIDHLLPASRGGNSDPDNLSVSCLKCNRARSNRIDIVQLRRLFELRTANDY